MRAIIYLIAIVFLLNVQVNGQKNYNIGTLDVTGSRGNTDSILPAPILLYPPNWGTLYPGDSLRWSAVSGALYYTIQLSMDSTFATYILSDTASHNWYIPPPGIGGSVLIFWRVRANNASGPGHFSVVWHFSGFYNPPPVPVLLSPANGATNVSLTPLFAWMSSTGAVAYRIQISTSQTFTTTVVNTVVTSTQYQVSSGVLNYNTTYYWRVNATNAGGTSNWSVIFSFNTIASIGIITISSEVPEENRLFPNYPNPFNPNTVIRFQIKEASNVMLKIYDMTGREINTLVNEKLSSGIYEIEFNASHLPSGVYFYRLTTNGFSETKRMLMIK